MTPLWAHELAQSLWSRAGSPPATFPRDLRRAIALALPVAVVDVPGLRLASLHAWLSRRGAPIELGTRDRPLRACLIAREGHGIIFVDGADPDDERRYSLAHEVAHFLIEHDRPRRVAAERLGPAAVDVLDGRRPAHPGERIDAALMGIRLSLDVHFLDRGPSGMPLHAAGSAAERRADVLALELLAPAEALQPYVSVTADVHDLELVLKQTFGLPHAVARARALELVPAATHSGLLERLGLPEVSNFLHPRGTESNGGGPVG